MEWFLKCVKEHYFDFNGRARRKEYWMFTLVNIIISVALSVVLGLISEKLLPIANLFSTRSPCCCRPWASPPGVCTTSTRAAGGC